MKGDFTAADTLLRQALATNQTLLTEPHSRLASNLSQIAQTRFLMGDGPGAVTFMRQSLDQFRRSLGEEHLTTIGASGTLAVMLAEVGDPVEAESLSRAALRRLDPNKPEHRVPWIAAQLGLGKALFAQRELDEALAVLDPLVGVTRTQYGEEHARTGEALLTHGTALVAKGRYADATQVLHAARAILEKQRQAQPCLAAKAVAAVERLPR